MASREIMNDGHPMKYIVFKSAKEEAPVLFPYEYIHSWMAGQLRPLEVVSAGFVEIGPNGDIRCYGHSPSLKIGSRGDVDSALVRRHLRSNDRSD
ncbi:MAG: hypothetical protein VW268_08375 [Rhodospirillaceae bacterium]